MSFTKVNRDVLWSMYQTLPEVETLLRVDSPRAFSPRSKVPPSVLQKARTQSLISSFIANDPFAFLGCRAAKPDAEPDGPVRWLACSRRRGPPVSWYVRPQVMMRRTLNALAVGTLLIVAALALFGGMPRTPSAVFGPLFAGLPAVAHCIAGVLAWKSGESRATATPAIVGLSLSSIALFAWVVIDALFFEMIANGKVDVTNRGIAVLYFAAAILPISSVVNVAHFGKTLNGAASSIHVA